MPKQLTVYKASAGSGKTFTLAVEYIKLLINNPHAYENILAVTFTNKATDEMKSRILSQLYGIANHLPDSNNYRDKVCEGLGISPEAAAEGAQKALTLLLHNYNFFRVQTIDTFFQSVMRNLARELSLNNNLKVSLNDKEVISQSVDSIMDSLSDNKELMKWIEEYVNESMDDDKTWNITNGIKDFADNLTKEFYKSNKHRLAEAFSTPKFFDEYKKTIKTLIDGINGKYQKIGKEAIDTIYANGWEITSFSRGSGGPLSYFLRLRDGIPDPDKLINSHVSKAFYDNTGWAAKGPKQQAIATFAQEYLVPLFNKAEKTREKDMILRQSAKKTLENLNKLRLLHAIEEEMRRINGDSSRFMLSSTQTLLHDMMKDDPAVAPFIFEKIGSKINHIMIDEFQDTSLVQWQNFRVLLDECMAKAKFSTSDQRAITNNLIVGDVKQSIYRFRSGDWRLLNNIEGDFHDEQIKQEPLTTNRRSARNIINFNNAFFSIAADMEAERIEAAEGFNPKVAALKKVWAEQLRKAYSDVRQMIPDNKPDNGQINIHLISPGCPKEEILAYTLSRIRTLLAINAKPGDIAILVRKNKDIPLIADFFSTNAPEIKLISEDAFRLDSSPSVILMVSAMKHIMRPDDKATKANLINSFAQYADEPLSKLSDKNSLLYDIDSSYAQLPEDITDEEKRSALLTLPLTEMAETLFRLFNLEKLAGQTIYVSTFFDKLNRYSSDHGSSLDEFLTYWDEELCSKTVAVGNVEGIRIMSIHKSKGLEFDHVIMPYCNWRLDPPFAPTLWCNVNEEPFSALPFIPVDSKTEKTLKGTIYEENGSEEAMQEIVDDLNLLYVAFTRAGLSLTVVGDMPQKTGFRATLIAEAVRRLYSPDDKTLAIYADTTKTPSLVPFTEEAGAVFTDADGEECFDFMFGSLTLEKQEDKPSENVFLRKSSPIDITAKSYANDAIKFRQSNKSRDFADDITDEDDSRRYVHNGTILHQIFSTIRTAADIDAALTRMEFEGIIYNEDTSYEKLREELKQKLSNNQVADWFSDRWIVFNECSILTLEDGKVIDKRPDRVITNGDETIVIDYKFGRPNKDHQDQVQAYMSYLTTMGHKNVKGFIWYVKPNNVEPVKSPVESNK